MWCLTAKIVRNLWINWDPTHHLDPELLGFVLWRMEVSARDAVLQIWHLSYKTKPGCPYPLEQQDVFLLLPGQECQISPYTILMEWWTSMNPPKDFHTIETTIQSACRFSHSLISHRRTTGGGPSSSRSAWAAYLWSKSKGCRRWWTTWTASALIQISRQATILTL